MPNLSRVLKSRLQKLVGKTGGGCVISRSHRLKCFDPGPLVDGLSLRDSWNSPARDRSLVTTRWSGSLIFSRSLYAFPVADGQHHLTPSPQKKLKREEYHTSTDFSKDVQLVFSNAIKFNSEKSQIHQDAQTLKVCSPQAAVELLRDQTRTPMGRSNGFERKYFQRQNEPKRQGAEIYACVDDTECTTQARDGKERESSHEYTTSHRKTKRSVEAAGYEPRIEFASSVPRSNTSIGL